MLSKFKWEYINMNEEDIAGFKKEDMPVLNNA